MLREDGSVVLSGRGVVDEEWLTRFGGGWLLGSLDDGDSVEMGIESPMEEAIQVLVPAVAVGVVAGSCCRGCRQGPWMPSSL
ncbi:hypothetical protein V6N13_012898 [Hibiscus sabdariffa]